MFNDLAVSRDIPAVPKLWSAEHWCSATQVTPTCSAADPDENKTFSPIAQFCIFFSQFDVYTYGPPDLIHNKI